MAQRIQKLPGVLPRIPSRSRRKPARWLATLALVGGIMSGGYWFVFVSPVFAISSVEVVGTDNPGVKAIAQGFRGKNIFRLRTAALEQEIKQTYPPAREIELVRGIPRTIRLAVILRRPALRWQTQETVFILDGTGQSFELGDKESYHLLPKVVDYSNVPVTIGQEVVSSAFLAFISEVATLAPEIVKRPIATLEVHETTLHLDVLLEGEIRLRLTTQRPVREQLEAAAVILATHPEARHLDIRVPRRGYYR